MLSYIEGLLTEKNPTQITIDINGIGFSINIPISSYDKLSNTGSKVKLLTYLYVREDALTLYGFVTFQERELFELLLSISGIGPRTAIGILSGISVDEFREYILNKNYNALTLIPGIGKKTAERLVLELYDKISRTDYTRTSPSQIIDQSIEIKNQAIQALCSLGFTRAIAEKSISTAILNVSDKLPLEELIKQALKTTMK
jgi:Holliday junction DNA helicase RuvA